MRAFLRQVTWLSKYKHLPFKSFKCLDMWMRTKGLARRHLFTLEFSVETIWHKEELSKVRLRLHYRTWGCWESFKHSFFVCVLSNPAQIINLTSKLWIKHHTYKVLPVCSYIFRLCLKSFSLRDSVFEKRSGPVLSKIQYFYIFGS